MWVLKLNNQHILRHKESVKLHIIAHSTSEAPENSPVCRNEQRESPTLYYTNIPTLLKVAIGVQVHQWP